MPRPVHFEYPVENVERAKKFYADAFGWTFQSWDGGSSPYVLVTTGPAGTPGIDGGLMTQAFAPKTPVLTLDVADLDESVSRVTGAGGTIVMPRFAVPGIGYMAYTADSEGITFGMMQRDASATD